MTKNELWNKYNSTSDKGYETIAYLYQRWQDEKPYENLSDYRKAIQRLYPKVKLISLKDKPYFMARFKCSDGDIEIGVKVKGENLIPIGRFIQNN